MIIKNKHGMELFCLPSNARCRVTGQNPERMKECPLADLPEEKEECIPEICDEYIEG